MALAIKPILTVDIVEFSKRRSGNEQMTALRALIHFLDKAIPEGHNNQKMRLWSPAGDGGSLTFEDVHAAVRTAVKLAQYIRQYNKGHKFHDADGQEMPRSDRPLEVRIGLHVGPVLKETDFDNRENVWGSGVNMGARVASLAKPNQIVASKEFVDQAELLAHPDYEVTNIGKWWAKHDISFELYNIFQDGGGTPGSEVGGWFDPFQYPLQRAIGTYSAMVEEEVKTGTKAFRVLVLAKRLLDLNPQYQRAIEMIESVSVVTGFRKVGEKILYDDFFSRLSPSALLYFFQNAQFEDFEAGNVIFRQGSRADSMMMVVLGEIALFIGGERIPNVALEEGDIIGEMGLFNPEGEKRTATLEATENTVTLSLNYDFLRPEISTKPSECNEIRAQIWRYYRNRTAQNLINTHRLFKGLSERRRDELIKGSKFLPEQHDQPIQLRANQPLELDDDGFVLLDAKDVWNNHWLVVVEGSVIVHTLDGTPVEFSKGDCLGPIRLAVTERPYDTVKISPNTHLIRLPWEIVEEFLHELKTFSDTCAVEGIRDRQRLGLGF
jgi:CRP-like cAMP-binding protein